MKSNIRLTLTEFNPMLGHRGCRLGISYPEITEMRLGNFEAAAVVSMGRKVIPEIMVPLIGRENEFKVQADVIRRV